MNKNIKKIGNPYIMRILVTGGSGMVGQALKSLMSGCMSDVIFLSSKDGNLGFYPAAEDIFHQYVPDIVIHLAANVGGLFKNMNHKVRMLEDNLLINYNVLHLAHQFEVQKVVSCLSTCIFPDKITYPIDETMLHLGPPHNSNDAYAYAKRMLEIHSRAYAEESGKDFVCVIPTNIYGKHDNFSLENGHVIPALIHKCYLAKKNGVDFVVSGTGKPLRQFIYADDLAELILMVLENYQEKEPIILSVDPEQEVSIAQVAQMIANCFDYQDRLVFDTNLPDGQYRKTASNKKLRSYVPDFQFTPLEKGISETVKWFQENYDQARK